MNTNNNIDGLINEIRNLVAIMGSGNTNSKHFNYNPYDDTLNRRGLNWEGIQKELDHITEKYRQNVETLERNITLENEKIAQIQQEIAQRRHEIENLRQQQSQFSSTSNGLDRFSETINNLEKEISDLSESIGKHNKNIQDTKHQISQLSPDKEKNQLLQQERDGAFHTLSNGMSSKVKNFGNSITDVGNSLSVLSKGNGALGKFGGALGKAGGAVTAAAGWIGIVIMAIQALVDAFNASVKALAEGSKVITSEKKFQFQYAKRRMQNEIDYDLTILKTEYDKNKAAIQQTGQNTLDTIKINCQKLIAASDAQIGTITDGIQSSVWKTAKHKRDMEFAAKKLWNVDMPYRAQNTGLAYKRAKVEQDAAQIIQDAANISNRIQYINDSERNAINWQHFQTEHYITGALASGEYKNSSFWMKNSALPGLQQRGIMEDINRPQDNRVGGGATNSGLYGMTGMEGSQKNPLTQQDYKSGVNAELSTAEHLYQSTSIHFKIGASQFGVDEGVMAWTDAQMEIRQWDRQQIAETAEFAADQIRNLTTQESIYRTDLQSDINNFIHQAAEEVLDMEKQVSENWMKLAQTIEEKLLSEDKIWKTNALTLGLRGDEQTMHDYSKFMIGTAETLARKYNINSEQMAQLSNTFATTTGRNQLLGSEDMKQALLLDKYVGEDGVGASLVSQMEIFNHGVADSSNMVQDMVSDIEKAGLNGKKYIKDLVSGLKLAERHQFKGGVKNMMEIAKWAQQTRFNINSLDNIVNKIQQHGLESVIDTSARLQVLGGGFAAGANPFSLLYDSYQDPASLMKNVNNMLGDIGGFDSSNGEATFATRDLITIKAAADAIGVDYQELLNQQRQRIKGNAMNSALSTTQLSEEDKNSVINKAYYEDGEWKVKLLKNGQVSDANVETLTADDIKFLNPQDHNERMESYMERLMPMADKFSGEQEAEQLNLAQSTYDVIMTNFNQRLSTAADTFHKNHQLYIDSIIRETQAASKAYKGFMEYLITPETVDATVTANKALMAASIGISASFTQAANTIKNTVDLLQSIYDKTKAEELAKQAGESAAKLTSKNNTNAFFDMTALHCAPIPVTWKPAVYMGMRHGDRIRNTIIDVGSNIWNGNWSEAGSSAWNGAKSLASETWTDIEDSWNDIWDNIWDGVVDGNNRSMMINASSVTPIHDGHVARTDPNDVGLFAKIGGPFDRLFNGVFGEIHSVHNILSTQPIGGNVTPVLSKLLQQNTSDTIKHEIAPVDIHLSGELMVKSENGQSVDIMDMLRNDVELRRQLTRMIADELNRSVNSGRLNYTDDTSYYI